MNTPIAPAPLPVSAPQGTDPPRQENVRDTIESIILALILAFVFRAFIVEAFVIPTGSMAPSLYGKHGQHRCANCQYPFAYGLREDMIVGRDPANKKLMPGTLAYPFTVQCPNCTWMGEGNSDLNRNRDQDPVSANSGDRILVLKWGYDIGGDWLGARRWDVAVFKDPQNGEMNFIKRVIGLPGEVLEIINGDVYVAPLSSLPDDILRALNPPAVPERPRPDRLNADQIARLARHLRIARKTPTAQESLWMLHYDHDYMPQRRNFGDSDSVSYDPPYWEGDTDTARQAWDATMPIIRYTPMDGSSGGRLVLRGKPICDDYGYNNVYQRDNQVPSRVNVGDVQVRFVLFPEAGEGHLALHLTKEKDRFRATLQSDGEVRFEMVDRAGVWRNVGQPERIDPFHPDRPLAVEFENLDYRVALRVNGREVAATEDADYAPDVAELLRSAWQDGLYGAASVSLSAEGIPLQIRHLQVLRDVFYRSTTITENTLRREHFADHPGWGTVRNPILLRTDPPEYFCCGDNSPQSKDSRLWVEVCDMLRARGNYQYGTVPGDQLIGRAFFVYWPSGLRLTDGTIGIIPNVGRMRIIR